MRALTEGLTRQFDYVIIDSQPVLAATDAEVMPRFVGGTIAVDTVGVARRNGSVAALDTLGGIANRIVLTRLLSKGLDFYHNSLYEYAKELTFSAAPTLDHPLWDSATTRPSSPSCRGGTRGREGGRDSSPET